MKLLPKVLIVGRPNVGKSTFVNRLLKKRFSITLDEPGITRDLVSSPINWNGVQFELVDSGGVLFEGPEVDSQGFQLQIEEKVLQAIEYASKIIMIVDGRAGLHPNDQVIAKKLLPVKSKVLLAVNKLDQPGEHPEINEFYKLGLSKPMPISSLHGHGILELMKGTLEGFQRGKEGFEDWSTATKVAFLGKPNVGKSSLVNAILNENRVLVSDIAGTTRDAVDVTFMYKKRPMIFMDTAGMRKKKKVDDGVEYYSVRRSLKSVLTADCVVVMIDAVEGLHAQDMKIINHVMEKGKSMILVVNKTDQLDVESSHDLKLLRKSLIAQVPSLRFFPILFLSATEDNHFNDLLAKIFKLVDAGSNRVSTSVLNQFVDQVVKRNPPPAKYGKRVKIYYATQVEISPPRFVFFVNHETNVSDDYTRFLEGKIREYLADLEGVVLHLHFRSEHGGQEPNARASSFRRKSA